MGRPAVNGPQHYAEAERLLGQAAGDLMGTPRLMGVAQVHATLALAAATALAIDPTPEAVAEWDPHLLDDRVVDATIACGRPLNSGQDEPSCVLEEGHTEYHSDGHGNRWTT